MAAHVLATFTHRSDAADAARRLRSGRPGLEAHVGATDDQLDALALGQRAEMDGSGPAMPAGIVSGPLARGASLWGAVGAATGALLTLPLALLLDAGDLPRWQVLFFVILAGAIAGGIVGMVLGAGRQAVKEGATTPEDPTAVVRVDAPGDRADDVVRFFVESGARSARYVDAPVSRPRGSDVEAPRPMGEGRAAATGPGTDYDAGFGSDVR